MILKLPAIVKYDTEHLKGVGGSSIAFMAVW